ncbi:MAG TPA: hypothetical protein VIV60_12445 [Polyangiaceae bacterium]
MVVKPPVEDQCTSAGLRGCDLIAEGVALYAAGDAASGEQSLGKGLRANASRAAELKKFADGLSQIGKVPGLTQHVSPMQPAIRLVQQIAAESPNVQPPPQFARTPEQSTPDQNQVLGLRQDVAKLAQPSPAVQSTVTPPSLPTAPPENLSQQSVAKFWQVAGNSFATGCKFAGTPKMQCLRERVDTRKVITDVLISSACPVDVMVASRAGLELDWLIYVPAGKGAELHGAALPLEPKRAFYVGIAQKGDDVTPDVRCGVSTVWYGNNDQGAEKARYELGAWSAPSGDPTR